MDYTSDILGYANSAAWTGQIADQGWTEQVKRGVQEIRANSVNPSNTSYDFVPHQGVAFKALVLGDTRSTDAYVVGYAKCRVLDTAPNGCYELGLNRIAGIDLDGNGSMIGSEGVTVRTNFGTNGNPSSDYGVRYLVTLFVPEPASMMALGSGLVGLLALCRRCQAYFLVSIGQSTPYNRSHLGYNKVCYGETEPKQRG